MTENQAIDYLESRAHRHGMTVSDLMDITPSSVSDCPREAAAFWEGKHVSHIYAQSTHPEIAQDVWNMMPEDPDPNQARGSDTMTSSEINDAHIDNWFDAMLIDITMHYDTPLGFI